MNDEYLKELYCKEISKIEGDPERIKDAEQFCRNANNKNISKNMSRWTRKYRFVLACTLIMVMVLGGVSAYAISKSGISLSDHFFRLFPWTKNNKTLGGDTDKSADNIIKTINDEIAVGTGKVIVKDQIYDRTMGKIYLSIEVYDNMDILCEDVINIPFTPFQVTMQTKDMPKAGDEVIVQRFYSEAAQTEIYMVFPKAGTYSFSPGPANGAVSGKPGMIFAKFDLEKELRNDPDFTFWYLIMDKETYYEFEKDLRENKAEYEKLTDKNEDAYLIETIEKYGYRKMEPQDLSVKSVRSGSINVIIGCTDTILRYNLNEDSIDSFAIQLSDGTTLIYLENNISTEKFVLEKGLAGADGSFGFNFTNQKLIDPDDVVKIIINEKEIEDNVSG